MIKNIQNDFSYEFDLDSVIYEGFVYRQTNTNKYRKLFMRLIGNNLFCMNLLLINFRL